MVHLLQSLELDRTLDGPAFTVDQLACVSAAHILRAFNVEGEAAVHTRAIKQELLYRISLAAICHSINWDFLSQRLARAFDNDGVDAAALAEVTARNISDWLAGYEKPDRIREKERAALLRNVGRVLSTAYAGDVLQLLAASKGHLQGTGGLLDRLDKFDAFKEDPLRKKSNVLIHEIVRDKLASFSDEHTIAPAIDYHIMRLYLRTGRVVPLHRRTLELLKHDSTPRPRLITLLRQTVSEALSLTAFYANLSIPTANSLEWQFGRAICDRIHPRCHDLGTAVKEQFRLEINCCPNLEFCLAVRDPEWLALREPDHRKSFY
jgi:hypothetical protein